MEILARAGEQTMRVTTLLAAIGSVVFLAGALSAQTCNPKLIGTWKNSYSETKSGAKEQTSTQTFKRKGNGVETTINNEPPRFFRCDGKDYPLPHQTDSDYDAWSVREKGDSAVLTFKRHGKVTATNSCDLSA